METNLLFSVTISAAFCVHIYSFMFGIHVFPQILKRNQFLPYLSYRYTSLVHLYFDSLIYPCKQ